MKLFDRYLLREHTTPLIYCLLGFCMVFIVYDLFDHLADFMRAQSPWHLVVFYYVCLLAPAMEYLAPAALLLATLYCLWQLSRHNEIVAMRASGISVYRVMLPFLMVGFIFSIAGMAVKETVAPYCLNWAASFSRRQYTDSPGEPVRNVVYYNARAHRVWDIGSFLVEQPSILREVKIVQERDDGARKWEIRAERAEHLDGQWWLFNAIRQSFRPNESPDGEPEQFPPVAEMLSLNELPDDIANSVKPWEMLSTLEMIRHMSVHHDMSNAAMAQRRYDIHNRMAMPWASLIVTLFAIPGGITSGRRNAMSGIFIAICFFLGFYALTQIGTFMGKRQMVEPWIAAWLSNGVFLTAALIMIRKVR